MHFENAFLTWPLVLLGPAVYLLLCRGFGSPHSQDRKHSSSTHSSPSNNSRCMGHDYTSTRCEQELLPIVVHLVYFILSYLYCHIEFIYYLVICDTTIGTQADTFYCPYYKWNRILVLIYFAVNTDVLFPLQNWLGELCWDQMTATLWWW